MPLVILDVRLFGKEILGPVYYEIFMTQADNNTSQWSRNNEINIGGAKRGRGWIIFESRVQVEFRVGIRVCGPPEPLTEIG